MYCTRKITDSVQWVGSCDRRLALFENLFPITYNSYLILDEKTALMDTVDCSVSRQFMENLLHALNGRSLDYLVINHMEPDHCAVIGELLLRFPEMQLVGNTKTLGLLGQFYEFDVEGRTCCVKDKDTLSLGKQTLQFHFTPMVHWPEVMMTYETSQGILFSADAFGSFGALGGNLFNDEVNFDANWVEDTRRYYGNIVGKYGLQVQNALKKLAGLDVRMICPLHGLVWRSNLDWLLGKYDLWSRYQPEEQTVALFYGSMYGDTENAVNILACALADAGVKNLAVYDVSSTHISTLISEVFRCSHLVLACPTYNNGVYPAMLNLLHDMKALNLQNRTVGLVENGSWAPAAAKQVTALITECKDMRLLDPVVTIKSSLKEEGLSGLMALKDSILASMS